MRNYKTFGGANSIQTNKWEECLALVSSNEGNVALPPCMKEGIIHKINLASFIRWPMTERGSTFRVRTL